MESGDYEFNIIDSYGRLIRTLSREDKLRLISRLSNSLKECEENSGRSINELYGAFVSEKSAEEILRDLTASKNFIS